MPIYYLINAFNIYAYINKLISSYKIEIIVTTNFLFAPFAIRAARKNSIPIIFDVVDFQPYHINYISFLPSLLKRIGKTILTKIFDFDIRYSDYRITTGLPLAHYIKQKGTQNFKIIANGVNHDLFNSGHDKTGIQEKYNLSSPVICFVGAMEYWINYSNLFQAISILSEKYPTIHCLFIGPSRHYGLSKIKLMAAKYNVLESIIFTGRVPYNQLPSYICASDVCILPFSNNFLTNCVIPMKLFEYLACERPVVSARLVGVKSVARNLIFYADTPEDFAKRMDYILSNKEKIQKKVILGRKLSEKFSWSQLALEYEKVLQEIKANHV